MHTLEIVKLLFVIGLMMHLLILELSKTAVHPVPFKGKKILLPSFLPGKRNTALSSSTDNNYPPTCRVQPRPIIFLMFVDVFC